MVSPVVFLHFKLIEKSQKQKLDDRQLLSYNLRNQRNGVFKVFTYKYSLNKTGGTQREIVFEQHSILLDSRRIK
jgi:hypothetical protein